ncbi:MAG TPA: tripartite tricarboxylate transporter substrate binding protein [Burkholderiales bacterium]|jgi:tripartite-type tricarboxylate transporter receptor subunit TctC|nr:tripartite tricarboxylate transporter substrate binding protein [Burkholderiales bacterium]
MTSGINLKSMMLALAAAWAGIPVAHAASVEVDKYPTKPIRLIAPFVPGGGTDITARAIAAKLSERWGQQVIVDNRAGAAGTIGVELTATAAPDGYTICIISASHSVNSATNPKLPYDLTRDLQGISQATSLFYVIHIHPSVPAKSVTELITYAKANPGKLSFGSSGTGGLQHFAGEMFNHLAGIKMVHIPYKGGAAATADLIGGNIQFGFGTLLSSRPHYKAGRLRPLGISLRQRSPIAPEFPTIAEAGLPGYEVDQWYGIITSAKVPRPLVDKLAAAIAEAVKSPETAQRLSGDGSTPVGSTPEQFSAHIRSEIAKWRKLVKDARLELH